MEPTFVRSAIQAFVLVALLAGCLEEGERPAGGDLRGDLRSVVLAHLEAYLARDVEGVLVHEHDPWVDLGGGSCGPDPPEGCDSANVTRDESRAMLASLFADEEYRAATEGRKLDDLFDVAGYNETGAIAAFEAHGSTTWFPFEAGDRAVHVPPREGSYFFDGFFRVYREVEGRWLAVAGD